MASWWWCLLKNRGVLHFRWSSNFRHFFKTRLDFLKLGHFKTAWFCKINFCLLLLWSPKFKKVAFLVTKVHFPTFVTSLSLATVVLQSWRWYTKKFKCVTWRPKKHPKTVCTKLRTFVTKNATFVTENGLSRYLAKVGLKKWALTEMQNPSNSEY